MVVVLVVSCGTLLFWGLYWLIMKLREQFLLTPEERWRRRYDKRLKKHFKSLSDM